MGHSYVCDSKMLVHRLIIIECFHVESSMAQKNRGGRKRKYTQMLDSLSSVDEKGNSDIIIAMYTCSNYICSQLISERFTF